MKLHNDSHCVTPACVLLSCDYQNTTGLYPQRKSFASLAFDSKFISRPPAWRDYDRAPCNWPAASCPLSQRATLHADRGTPA